MVGMAQRLMLICKKNYSTSYVLLVIKMYPIQEEKFNLKCNHSPQGK
jgi:hypothetical protein